MPRLAGVDIPENKRAEVALTYIYGIGPANVAGVLRVAGVSGDKRAKDLTDEEVARLSKVLENFKLEGDLRKEVSGNINRLREIGAYRGMRHARNLPARGQRTRTNARTKRGKRVTIGALKKEMATKIETAKAKDEEVKK